MKTFAEVDELKARWRDDPCWDIENTEGFEEHYDELLAYRRHMQTEEDRKYYHRLKNKSLELGTTNVCLAGYVLRLEERLEDLERRVGA